MRLKHNLLSVLTAAAFATTLIIWGFASPPGSGPDDNDHLPSIWCARGYVQDLCDPGITGDGMGKTLSPLVQASDCFAYKSDTSAACQAELFKWDDSVLINSVTNEVGRFPNGFYWILNSFIGENTLYSAILMRVFNSLLAVIVFFLSFYAIKKNLRVPLIMAWLGATLPLVLFTIPSTNPSSWTIIGLGTYWALLLSYMLEDNVRKRLFSGVMVLFTALISLTSRSESAPYLIIITVTIFLLIKFWNKLNAKDWTIFLIPFGVIFISVYEFLTTPSTLGISTGLPGGDPNRSLEEVWSTNIMRFPVLYTGALGKWNMGWMDTPTPDITFFFTIFIFSGLVFVGINFMSKYKFFALLFLLSFMAFIPLRILALGKNIVGENVQPRYLLPFLFVLIGVSLFIPYKDQIIGFSKSQLIFIATGLSIGHAFALHQVMRRYITGTDVVSWNLNRKAEWWWEPLPSPMVTWFIAVVAYSLMISIAVSYVNEISKKSQQLQL